MSTDPPLIEVRGLIKRCGGLTAVNKIDFDLRQGEIVGLIGPNGSGKSTIMKLILGIERPSAGSIRLDGNEIAGLPAHRIARKGVGLVFQHSRPLERQTVIENIKLGLLPDSLVRLFIQAELENQAHAIAERVGLGQVLDRRPSTLPYADLRRLELAKAIARNPRVILLDEPFAGGERIAEGTAAAVMQNETVRRAYLGGSIETTARPESVFKDDRPLLEVSNLSVFYGKAQALERVSIHVHEGEFVSVVGINGAGKTTLFNTISGFVPFQGNSMGRTASGRSLASRDCSPRRRPMPRES
jgi:ABC-type branched-subunit amino acid transport system ATPase component